MTETGEKRAVKVARKKREKVVQRFNPHETARVDSLAGAPLATFRQRLIAYSIDGLIVLILNVLLVAYLNHLIHDVWHINEDFYHSASGHTSTNIRFEPERFKDLIEVFWVLTYFGLSVWWTNGLTLGKRLMRIRVVSLTHERITLWQSSERALGYGASALEAGFGFFQYFIYPNHTCVHDRIAETIVVQEPKRSKPERKPKSAPEPSEQEPKES